MFRTDVEIDHLFVIDLDDLGENRVGGKMAHIFMRRGSNILQQSLEDTVNLCHERL